MPACPDTPTLEQLLAGSLGEQETAACRTHLEGCGRCRAALDQLSDDSVVRQWAEAAATSRGDQSVPGRWVEELCARLAAGAEEAPPGEPDLSLSFLGPARHEGDLGTLGPYRVQALLARGGMGLVLRGYDDVLERPVAIKVACREQAQGPALGRLLYEAQAAAHFRHEHAVQVHAVARTPEGLPYIVMEYVAGLTLAERLRSDPPLPPGEVVTLVAQVADALAAAHAEGLIHRDVKPSNILIERHTGRAKILDFGLARLAERPSGITQEGALAGTPTYMSPEQVQGLSAIDGRTDVYSLGATLYEALTGVVPFQGKPHLVMQQVLSREPTPPRRLNDAVPRDLEVVCLKALAKEPSRRYQSARELADDLRRWQRGEPIRARPAGPVERLLRWCRRNPGLALLQAAVVGVLLLAALGATVAAAWISRARAQAERERSAALEARRLAEEHAAAAARAEERAGAHFSLALDTLQTLVGKVQSQLRDQPGALKLRQELLQTAVDGLDRIVHSAQRSPEASRALMEAHERLGQLYFQLGQRDRARQQFEACRRTAETLLQTDPEDAPLQRALANALDCLGNLALYGGDPAGAKAYYLQALDRRQTLAHAEPVPEQVALDLARSYGRLGDVCQQQGDGSAARRWYEQALAVLQSRSWSGDLRAEVLYDLQFAFARLGEASLSLHDYPTALAQYHQSVASAQAHVAAQPGSIKGQCELADAWGLCATASLRQGDPVAAEQACRRALEILGPLAAENPNNALVEDEQGRDYQLLGDALRGQGNLAGARSAYEKALALRERAASREPDSLTRLRAVLRVCWALADVDEQREEYRLAAGWMDRALTACRRLEAARPAASSALRGNKKFLEEALAVETAAQERASVEDVLARPKPLATSLLAVRASALARRGRHHQAAALAERLRRLCPEEPDKLFEVGRIYALCAEAVRQGPSSLSPDNQSLQQTYLDQAIAALGEAARRSRRVASDLEDCPDLCLVRASPAFRKLLRELPGQAKN